MQKEAQGVYNSGQYKEINISECETISEKCDLILSIICFFPILPRLTLFPQVMEEVACIQIEVGMYSNGKNATDAKYNMDFVLNG